jgi:hypothetical protein
MVKYLSTAWFEQLRNHADRPVAPSPAQAKSDDGRTLVLRQIVTGGPEGDVVYDVVFAGGRARVDPSGSAEADLTFTSDYATASAIGSGRLSTQAALSAGRLSVRGDVTVLATGAGDVSAADPVPAELRAATEY